MSICKAALMEICLSIVPQPKYWGSGAFVTRQAYATSAAVMCTLGCSVLDGGLLHPLNVAPVVNGIFHDLLIELRNPQPSKN